VIKDGAGRAYLALFHPAAALYNGAMRDVLMADFARIPKALSNSDIKPERTGDI
jgi:uracil-DNA glycosylase